MLGGSFGREEERRGDKEGEKGRVKEAEEGHIQKEGNHSLVWAHTTQEGVSIYTDTQRVKSIKSESRGNVWPC